MFVLYFKELIKVESKGKPYASRKKAEERPDSDFYPTPFGLTEVLVDFLEKQGIINKHTRFLEPACGSGAITRVLRRRGYQDIVERDLRYGQDFLTDDYSNEHYDVCITNPPFSLWDEFVEKGKKVADLTVMLGRTNYFAAHSRNVGGVWDKLERVVVFDRQAAYDKWQRLDGKFYCGCLVTGFFIWRDGFRGEPKLSVLDTQAWAYKRNTRKLSNSQKKDISEFKNTYIISDLHFGHKNIIKYCNRPYEMTADGIKKMNEDLVALFDSIPDGATIWNLGDVFWHTSDKDEIAMLMERMHEHNHILKLVLGNHDNMGTTKNNRIIKPYKEIGFDDVFIGPVIIGDNILLSHEPVYLGKEDDFINLYGHTHDVLVGEDYFEYDEDDGWYRQRDIAIEKGTPIPQRKVAYPEKAIDVNKYYNVCFDNLKKIVKISDILDEISGRQC